MRILQVMLSRKWGGGERNAFDIALQLAREDGVEVCVAARKDSDLARRLGEMATGVQLATVPHLGSWDWRTRGALIALCRRFRPDVVHTHFNRASAVVGGIMGSVPALCIASLHGKYDPKYYRGFRHVVVATRALVDYVAERFPPDVTAHLLPLAVPPPGPAGRVSHKGLVIGAIGRLHPVKGFDFLIDAFARYLALEPSSDTCLVIAGSGDEGETLRARARGLGIEARVRFPGWVETVSDFYAGIDLLAVPSRSESFGLVILEAAHYGLPVVATDTDGPRELLAAHQLVPVGDVEELARRLREALAQPARFRAPESQDMQGYVRDLLTIYRRALDITGQGL